MDLRQATTFRSIPTGTTTARRAELARRLTVDGVTVAGIGRDKVKLDQAAAALGPAFEPFVADLSQPHTVQSCAETIVDRYPHIDLLVCNAAQTVFERPTVLRATGWRELIETNLLSAITLIQVLLPRLDPASHVVVISSATAHHVALPGYAPYALTKSAFEAFIAAMRLDIPAGGPRLTVIRPGLVDTPAYDHVAGFAVVEENCTSKYRCVGPHRTLLTPSIG